MKHSVKELVLDNGARGLLIDIPDATVMTFDFNFRAGEYLMPREKWETPHIMEHMLLGANTLIPKARAFQAEFEKNGAYSNASTGSYDITYEAECADFEWERILDLLLVAISHPLFKRDEFEAEFGNVREELAARSNNHFRHLSLALRERYGFSVLTDQERRRLMGNVKLKDIQEHYVTTHTTSNMRFVIAGKLSRSRVESIKELVGNMKLRKGTGRKTLPVEKPVGLEEPLLIRNRTVSNLYFYIDTFLGRRLGDPEADALGLINTMLTETLYSRILGTARERGLVYGMSSGYGQTRSSSNWWIGAQIMPKNAPALFDIIIEEIGNIFQGKLGKDDIEMAKQYALGRYQRSGQTVGGTANGYSYRYFFDDHIDDYYQIPQRIKAITKSRIVDVMRAMFADKVWGFGVLGNSDKAFVTDLQQRLSVLW